MRREEQGNDAKTAMTAGEADDAVKFTSWQAAALRPAVKVWAKRLLLFLMISIAILPIFRLGFLIHEHAVNVPYWDDWSLAMLIRKSNAGTLTFGDFWIQHNEHLLVFPQMIMLGMAKLTKWNSVSVMYLSFAIAVASFGLLTSLLVRTLRSDWLLTLIALDVSAWIWFSPVQWENWLWGWQVQWFMSIFGLLLTMVALERWIAGSKPFWFALALLGAFFSTFCLGNGGFAWIAGFAYLAFAKPPRFSKRLWVMGTMGTGWLFLAHFKNPKQQPDKLLFVHQPGKLLGYVERYLGRPFAGISEEAAHFGAIMLVALGVCALVILLVKRDKLPPILPWFCLGVYTLLSALTTGISRMGYGVTQALSSRYTTVANLAIIGTIIMLLAFARAYLKPMFARVLAFEFCFLLASLINSGDERNIRDFVTRHQQMRAAYNAVHQATSNKGEGLVAVYPQPKDIWADILDMRQAGWAGLDKDFPLPKHLTEDKPTLRSADKAVIKERR